MKPHEYMLEDITEVGQAEQCEFKYEKGPFIHNVYSPECPMQKVLLNAVIWAKEGGAQARVLMELPELAKVRLKLSLTLSVSSWG